MTHHSIDAKKKKDLHHYGKQMMYRKNFKDKQRKMNNLKKHSKVRIKKMKSSSMHSSSSSSTDGNQQFDYVDTNKYLRKQYMNQEERRRQRRQRCEQVENYYQEDELSDYKDDGDDVDSNNREKGRKRKHCEEVMIY